MSDSLAVVAGSVADTAGQYTMATVDSLVGRIDWERVALCSQQWFVIGSYVKDWLPYIEGVFWAGVAIVLFYTVIKPFAKWINNRKSTRR